MKTFRLSGALGYLMLALWFLLIAAAPGRAGAQSPPAAQAREVSAADIMPDIEAALAVRGVDPLAEIVLADPAMLIAVTPSEAIAFSSVSFNPNSGRFVIRVDGAAPAAIAGVAQRRQRAAVANRLIARGETIGVDDIDWADAATSSSSPVATREEEIVGKIARRPLAAGGPVRLADIAAPILVRRGDTVTMVLEGPGLRLTQQGVAVTEGGAGDLVEIRNVASDRVIKAVVVAERLARLPGRAAQGL